MEEKGAILIAMTREGEITLFLSHQNYSHLIKSLSERNSTMTVHNLEILFLAVMKLLGEFGVTILAMSILAFVLMALRVFPFSSNLKSFNNHNTIKGGI